MILIAGNGREGQGLYGGTGQKHNFIYYCVKINFILVNIVSGYKKQSKENIDN